MKNRIQQKSAKWGTQWIRKKECDKLLSPNVRNVFGLLQNVLAPILPVQTDVPLVTLTNETPQMADTMDEISKILTEYLNNNLI